MRTLPLLLWAYCESFDLSYPHDTMQFPSPTLRLIKSENVNSFSTTGYSKKKRRHRYIQPNNI